MDLEEQGQSMKVWGPSFRGKTEADKRILEYRFHQKGGLPERLEVYAVTRNTDGSAKAPKVLSVDWPLAEAAFEQQKLARTPKDDASYTYEQLGYVEGKDALDSVDRGVYGYVVYTKTHRENGKRQVRIQTSGSCARWGSSCAPSRWESPSPRSSLKVEKGTHFHR